MGSCNQIVGKKECGRATSGTETKCAKHRPKTVTKVVTYTLFLARSNGATDPNTTFADLAASTKKTDPYAQRIEHLRGAGPKSGGAELVHSISCLHDTQPSNNKTVWYSWADTTITIWGLGNHTGGSGAGNNQYSMLWFDGTTKSWSR